MSFPVQEGCLHRVSRIWQRCIGFARHLLENDFTQQACMYQGEQGPKAFRVSEQPFEYHSIYPLACSGNAPALLVERVIHRSLRPRIAEHGTLPPLSLACTSTAHKQRRCIDVSYTIIIVTLWEYQPHHPHQHHHDQHREFRSDTTNKENTTVRRGYHDISQHQDSSRERPLVILSYTNVAPKYDPKTTTVDDPPPTVLEDSRLALPTPSQARSRNGQPSST